MEVSVGERIRFTATDHDRKVKSNDLAVVTEIDKVGKITLDAGGRKVVLDPREQKDQHFDYGYAVTTYSSQGASVPYIIGLVGVDGARERMASWTARMYSCPVPSNIYSYMQMTSISGLRR
jgi:hypothetical protein